MSGSTRCICIVVILFALFCLGISSSLAENGEPEWIDFEQGLEGDASYVSVASSSTAGLSLRVALPGMYTYSIEMADGQTYTAVSVPGAKAFETGKPAVPVFSEWILIPNGTEAVVSVDWGVPLVYSDMYLPPGQPLSGDCDGELILPFAKDEETYGIPGDCPGEFAWLEPTQMLRGQACAIIWLFPYQHDPVARTLKVYPHLRVNILFQGGRVAAIPPELRSAAFEDVMRRMAINAEAIVPEEVPPGEYETGPYGWDYIILIGDTTFEPAANKLAAWKKKLGFKPLLHKVPAKWDELAIKTALEGAYKNWQKKPKYVLIIGDAEYVPCCYGSWHPHNLALGGLRCDCSACGPEPANTQHYVATDLYYATMDGPDDLVPEMFMGRFSVDTASQAMKRVDDIIKYEQNPVTDPTFYNHVAIAAEFEDQDIYFKAGDPDPYCKRNTYEDKRFTQTSEDMALFLEHPNYQIEKDIDRIYHADPAVTPTYWCNEPGNFGGGPAGNPGTQIPSYLLRSSGFVWNGSGENIASALNSGRFLLTYRGHGARDFWRSPKFDAQTFQALNNGDKLPVIWSLSCQTGWFDNETDYFWMLGDPYPTDLTPANLVCFSELWERRPTGGAIGIVAGTRVTFGFLNEHLSWGMTNAIWPSFNASNQPVYNNSPIRRMGEVLYYGRQHMMKAKISSTDEKQANYEAYHWFGDPAMEIRTKKPIQIVAAHPKPDWPWMLHPRDFMVEVWMDDGDQYQGPLEKATVTISKQDSPSDYWVGKTDEEGRVTFSGLVTGSLGEYDVVVTATDTTTYEGAFESVAGPGGILLDAEIYGCPSDVGIKLADADLAGVGSVYQVVETGIDVETVELTETSPVSGVFAGSILATFSPDVHGGDGILQVTDGATISVVYADQGDTALVDCDPPAFEGLAMAQRNRERGCVELEWVGAYDDHGPILYNIYRYGAGSDTGILIGTTWSESYTDFDAAPGQTYRYVVRAQDAAGNEAENSVEVTVKGCPLAPIYLLL